MELGHSVQVVDATRVPDPGSLENRPDILFVIHGFDIPRERILAFREAGIPTAVYLLDEPYEVDRSVTWSRNYDVVFTVDKVTVPVHAEFTRAEYLPLAYNHHIFKPEGPAIPSRILVLSSPFDAREKYLAAIRDRWGKLITWVGPGWKEFSSVGQHHEGFADPDACARFYRGADIVINIHRDSFWSHFGDLNSKRLEATHLNPRFWETAGCKSLQLCSYRPELEKYARPGIWFTGLDDFMAKTEYFLENEKARKENALYTWKKLKNQTYLLRCSTVLNSLLG